MKAIKMIGLAALAALMAMAFVGASSAMAEATGLCSADENPCSLANAVTHVHETSVGKAKLLTTFGTTECNVLFLGEVETVGEENALSILGNFTYTNCELLGGSCTATEENGPAEIRVLKEGHETAKVTGEGLVHLVCGKTIDCSYNGTGLVGTAKGPLLSKEANGEVTLSGVSVTKETGGFICPKTSTLDITTTPLVKTYITSDLHYCVAYDHPTHGYYENSCKTVLPTREGPDMLVVGPAGYKVGEHVCAYLVPKPIIGLYEDEECTKDDKNNLSDFELGEIILVE